MVDIALSIGRKELQSDTAEQQTDTAAAADGAQTSTLTPCWHLLTVCRPKVRRVLQHLLQHGESPGVVRLPDDCLDQQSSHHPEIASTVYHQALLPASSVTAYVKCIHSSGPEVDDDASDGPRDLSPLTLQGGLVYPVAPRLMNTSCGQKLLDFSQAQIHKVLLPGSAAQQRDAAQSVNAALDAEVLKLESLTSAWLCHNHSDLRIEVTTSDPLCGLLAVLGLLLAAVDGGIYAVPSTDYAAWVTGRVQLIADELHCHLNSFAEADGPPLHEQFLLCLGLQQELHAMFTGSHIGIRSSRRTHSMRSGAGIWSFAAVDLSSGVNGMAQLEVSITDG
jgi:hypothetical protein